MVSGGGRVLRVFRVHFIYGVFYVLDDASVGRINSRYMKSLAGLVWIRKHYDNPLLPT